MSRTRGPGRRPGDPEVTKRAILDAAREVFGNVGFDRATMRGIAAQADVDPALIHHHFGTKQDLFAAAHELPFSPRKLIAQAAAVPPEERAELIVRLYLTVFAAPGSPSLSLIKAAATNEPAAAMLREFVESVLLSNADMLVEQPNARLRIALLGSHMIGVVMARSVIQIPEIRDIEVDDLVTLLVPIVERYLFSPDL